MNWLRLFAPILFPRWNFFDRIGSSWSVEWQESPSHEWRALMEVSENLTLTRALTSFLWNPLRNEFLFIISLAERAISGKSPDLLRLFKQRLRLHLEAQKTEIASARFRILADGETIAIGSILTDYVHVSTDENVSDSRHNLNYKGASTDARDSEDKGASTDARDSEEKDISAERPG